MATPKQYAIRNVAKATFYNITTGKPIVYLTDLKTSGIDNTADTVYARGGDGNAKIVGFSSNREAKVNLENAIFDNRVIAQMTGNSVATGAKEIYRREVLTVASNSATLTKTPALAGALVALYEKNADGTEGTELTYNSGVLATGEYSVTTKTITLYTGDYADGTELIAYYKVDTDATAETVTVSSDTFAGSFKLVLDCIVKSTYDKQDYAAQIIIPTCKMEDNWGITMSADGDPAVHTIPIEILKPSNSSEMWTMTVYDDSLVS